MNAIVLQERCEVEIPEYATSLAGFRRWATSDDFPRTGRIDFICGRIEVDMTADRINSHTLVFMELATEIARLVRERNLGQVLGSDTLVVSVPADLSCEPDMSVVLWESLRSGRVRYLPAPKAVAADDVLEVEGGPDLVVEIISPSSQQKDTRRLPPAYFAAGVRELWLVDARGHEISFLIHRGGAAAFEVVPADSDGFRKSDVLDSSFRLKRSPGPVPNTWVYRLEHREGARP
ncbi:MAG: Uma2 family endonuclease [Planctomycetota bacterium]|nr:Uma2 family endonuclease [Planctomycetota bacterium]